MWQVKNRIDRSLSLADLEMQAGGSAGGGSSGQSDSLAFFDEGSRLDQVLPVKTIYGKESILMPDNYQISITTDTVTAIRHLTGRCCFDRSLFRSTDFQAITDTIAALTETLQQLPF